MTTLLDINNLAVKLGNQTIVTDVNLEINSGEIIFLLGANGSGKSTFIKAILGLIKPNSGTIKINGKSNNRVNISQFVGYVPQYTSIDRDFPISVKEVILLECNSGPQCEVKPAEHLKKLGASHLINKKISDLSGGEFQKMLIARALTTNPEFLILDEPFNNLDENSQKELMNFIEELNEKQNKTILIVTHDIDILKRFENKKVLFVEQHKIKHIDNSYLKNKFF